MTDRYAVIGNPVAHSKSPWIHAEFARATGQDLRYDRIEAPLDGFERTVQAFGAAGGRGANVTLPFKETAFGCCARTSERARAAGVVNTLCFERDGLYGDNTDGVGLARDLTANLGVTLEGRSILIAGAGGAAQGVLDALLALGAARIVLANRTVARALALAARYPPGRIEARGYEALGEDAFELVINATSAGLTGVAPPLPPGLLRRALLAYDLVYGRDTPFLLAARAAGVRACDGLGMLVEQAAESFALWRGVRPETAPVLAALRAAR